MEKILDYISKIIIKFTMIMFFIFLLWIIWLVTEKNIKMFLCSLGLIFWLAIFMWAAFKNSGKNQYPGYPV